jgi:integrase/recombinase XerD
MAETRIARRTRSFPERENDHGPARLRTSAFIRVLPHTGIRIEEAISADVSALGHERGLRTLRIVGKGTKPKKRRLPVETGYALDRYLEDRARRR